MPRFQHGSEIVEAVCWAPGISLPGLEYYPATEHAHIPCALITLTRRPDGHPTRQAMIVPDTWLLAGPDATWTPVDPDRFAAEYTPLDGPPSDVRFGGRAPYLAAVLVE